MKNAEYIICIICPLWMLIVPGWLLSNIQGGSTVSLPILGTAAIILLFLCLVLFRVGISGSVLTYFDIVMMIGFMHLWFTGILFPVTITSIGYIGIMTLYSLVRMAGGRITVQHFSVCSVTALFIISIHGYLQYLDILPSNNSFSPITGVFSSSALYSGFMAMLIGICSFVAWEDPASRMGRFAFAGAAAAFPILLLADSRASLLGLLVALAYFFYHAAWKGRWRNRIFLPKHRLYILPLVAVSIAAGLYLLYQKRTDSMQGRFLIWKVSFDMIRDRPLTGFGPGGFESHYMHYQAGYLDKKGTFPDKKLAGNTHVAFNEPLRIAVEYGLLSLALYLGLLLFIWIKLRGHTWLFIAARSIFLLYIILSLFSYPASNYAFMLWYFFLFALVANSSRHFRSGVGTSGISPIPLKIVGILWCLWIGKVTVENYSGFRRFHEIAKRRDLSLHDRILLLAGLEKKLDKHLGYLTSYATLLYRDEQYGQCLDVLQKWEAVRPVNELYILKGDCLKKLGAAGEAERAYHYADSMVPSRQRSRTRLALLYHETGREEEGKKLALSILQEDVKVYGFGTYELHRQLKETFNLNQSIIEQ